MISLIVYHLFHRIRLPRLFSRIPIQKTENLNYHLGKLNRSTTAKKYIAFIILERKVEFCVLVIVPR